MTLPSTAWTHPHVHRFPALTWAALAAEFERELAARARTYPDQIERGRMTEAEADWQLQLARAWREDCARFEQAHQPLAAGRPMIAPREIASTHGIAWPARRAGLLRELDYRRRLYPQWIATLRITEAEAAQRTAALECLLALYELGYDWLPANTVPPAWDEAHPTPEQRATREEITALLAHLGQRTTTPQEELAL